MSLSELLCKNLSRKKCKTSFFSKLMLDALYALSLTTLLCHEPFVSFQKLQWWPRVQNHLKSRNSYYSTQFNIYIRCFWFFFFSPFSFFPLTFFRMRLRAEMQSKIEGFLEVVSSKKRFNDRELKLITSDHRSSYPIHCSLKMLGTNTSTYYLEIRKAISYLIVYKKKKTHKTWVPTLLQVYLRLQKNS